MTLSRSAVSSVGVTFLRDPGDHKPRTGFITSFFARPRGIINRGRDWIYHVRRTRPPGCPEDTPGGALMAQWQVGSGGRDKSSLYLVPSMMPRSGLTGADA